MAQSKSKPLTWKKLGEAVGYSISYINQLRRTDSNAPTNPDIDEWQKYFNSLTEIEPGKKVSKAEGDITARLKLAQADAAEQMAESRRIENQRKKGELVDRASLNEMFSRMGIAMHALLSNVLETRITTCAGYSGSQLREWGRSAHIEICEVMQKSIEEWTEANPVDNEGLGDDKD